MDSIKPAGDLPPDMHKLTIKVESVDKDSQEELITKMALYGTRNDLAMLQAMMETLIEALNEASKED